MKLKSMLSHLHSFNLVSEKGFNLETLKELLSSCINLTSLSINCIKYVDLNWNSLNVNIPNLVELKFHLNVSMNDDGLELLLKLNPNLKKLYLDECISLTPNAIQIIARCLPNLEELSLGYLLQKVGAVDLWCLSELKQSKSLTVILGPALSIIHVMSENGIPIENLILWYVDVPDALIDKILKLKQIKSLAVYNNGSVNIKDAHLELLAKNLPSLTEFRLSHSNHVTLDALKNFVCCAKVLELLALNDIKNITTNNKDDLLYCVDQHSNLAIEIDSSENSTGFNVNNGLKCDQH
ncbi:uncharacterized protein LOC116344917 [Contarinia nasturtii]|uniref:uncharacterized protein LOC116344917 n=1 Tax=Contarinia nasturtii TaxID=265458 RepID=UPI0012D3E1BB|nr:uncharacterized protein LOC116344917 [Contarinia nasturtii]